MNAQFHRRYDEHLHEVSAGSQQSCYKSITPNIFLRHTIHRYFVLTNNTANTPTYILPDNSAHLVFYLFDHGNTIVPIWNIIGPRSAHTIINRQHRLFTFICTFKPGAIRSLINVPVSEIRDLPIDSHEILRNYHPVVFEQLTHHALNSNIGSFVTCLESFLTKFIGEIHPAVEGFYDKFICESRPLTDASKELGYSDRQLRNLIQTHIGHSPKMVQQIERFANSLKLRKSTRNWASVAHSSGYYDQSHMIGDYQKLVGMSPDRLVY